MSVAPEVRDVLLGAAEVIAERGWCQGRYLDSSGAVCIEGSLRRAAQPSHDHLFEACLAVDRNVGRDIVAWNDAPGRTAEEVIAKLREVAAS